MPSLNSQLCSDSLLTVCCLPVQAIYRPFEHSGISDRLKKGTSVKVDWCILLWCTHGVLVYWCIHSVAVKSEHWNSVHAEILCMQGTSLNTFWQIRLQERQMLSIKKQIIHKEKWCQICCGIWQGRLLQIVS